VRGSIQELQIAVDANRKPPFRSKLWTCYRSALEQHFGKKCAICENLVVGQRKAAVDHYRPKGDVRKRDGTAVTRVALTDGADETHPGYWWLAYRWGNLLPLCTRCNTYQKKCFFPVAGDYSWDSIEDLEELDRLERPLLINPLVDDFDDHFEVDVSTYEFKPKSAKGDATIELMGLNNKTAEDNILGVRQQSVSQALSALTMMGKDILDNRQPMHLALELMRDLERGATPFAFTLRHAWQAARARLKAFLG
jgi:hypothetical protein